MKYSAYMTSIFLIPLVFSACSDSSDVTSYDESKTTGSMDFTLSDYGTSSRIDSVKVDWIKNGTLETQYTDENGHLTISDLPSGNYTFTLSKSNYATLIGNQTFTPSGQTEMPIIPDVDASVKMHRLGVTISGKVKLELRDGSKEAVKGAVVDLKVGLPDEVDNGGLIGHYELETLFYSTTTDKNGVFTFDSIPEGLETYSLQVRNFTQDGVVYHALDSLSAGTDLKFGQTITLDSSFILTISRTNLVINNFESEKVSSADTLELVFSDTVDVSEIETNDISVSSESIIATNYAFSSGKTVLKVWPVQGNWGIDGNYTLSLDLISTSGSKLDTTLTFYAINTNKPTTIKGFELEHSDSIEYSTSSLTFKWNKAKKVSGYALFQKQSSANNFTLVNKYALNDTTTTISTTLGEYNLTKDTIVYDTVQYMVVSYTSTGYSSFDSAKVISVYDNMVSAELYSLDALNGGTYNNGTLFLTKGYFFDGDTTYYWNNSSYSSAASVVNITFRLPPDADTSATVKASISGTTELSASTSWITKTPSYVELQVKIMIPAKANASRVTNATLKLSGLKDMAGNQTSKTIPLEATIEIF
jgi:hypothetical protein